MHSYDALFPCKHLSKSALATVSRLVRNLPVIRPFVKSGRKLFILFIWGDLELFTWKCITPLLKAFKLVKTLRFVIPSVFSCG